LHREGFAIFLFAISLFNPYGYALLLVYLIFIRKRIRFIYLVFGFLIIFLSYQSIQYAKEDNDINHITNIKQIKKTDQYLLITISYQGKSYHIYDYQNRFKVGDTIYVKGEIKPYLNNTIPNGFNQKQFYLSQGVYGFVITNEIQLIKSNQVFYTPREYLMNRVEHLKSQSLMMSFIFGENTFDENESKLYRELNIYFLLSISGLHIYMLSHFIKKIAFHLNINRKKTEIFEIIYIFIFLYFNLFAYGIFRIFLMKILGILNQKFRINLTKLDLIQLTFFLLICINKHLIFSLGFLMLYLIINVIVLLSPISSTYQFYLKRLFLTTIIQIVILPFQLKFSFLSILLMPFISIFIAGPLFLLSILTMIFHRLDEFLYMIFSKFNFIFEWIRNSHETLYLKAFSPIMILLYYLFVIFLFLSQDYKRLLIRCLIIISFIFINALDFSNHTHIFFLDVGQGDSAVIISKRCVAIIDSYMNVSSFLRNQGISEIDYLMLTHHHNDHTKEAQTILDSFHVKHLVLSKYDTYSMNHQQVLKVKSEDRITCGEINFHFLGPIRMYSKENDNSLVVQFTIFQMTYLFTGDIEIDAENDLIFKYQHQLKSDILKVAHHGSISSSSSNFIQHVQPKIAIVSSGRRNRYGFPNPTVIERITKINAIIYQTQMHGTIQFTYSRKKQNWVVHLSIESKI
jgi:competence protein ComEC